MPPIERTQLPSPLVAASSGPRDRNPTDAHRRSEAKAEGNLNGVEYRLLNLPWLRENEPLFPVGPDVKDRCMSPERQAAIDRLRFYLKQFDELMGLLESGKPLSRHQKSEARERLIGLKHGLRDEARELNQKNDYVDHFQRHFLEPALRQAGWNINTNANTVPDQQWHRDLDGARKDISHTLHELEQLPDDWRPGD